MNISRRQYYATHCPHSWFDRAMPTTIGEVTEALIARGIIPESRRKEDAMRRYKEDEVRKLMVALRWEYADMMVEWEDMLDDQGCA